MESRDVQSDLLRALGAWSAVSVIGGAALWAAADRRESAAMRAFARQQVTWGGIDGAIAAVGALRQRRGSAQHDPERLRRILRFNAVLDVGYVTAGGAMVALRDRLGARPGYSQEQALGDGLGIMVQGGFLLLLDATHATR